MINIGTLLVFYLVSNALLYRRYVTASGNPPPQILLFLFLLSTTAVGLSLSWKLDQRWWGLPLFGSSTITIVSFFNYTVPCLPNPSGWSMPFMPWPPSISIVLNIFLIGTLKSIAFKRFAIWGCLITLFYILYGVHSTYKADEETLMEMDQLGGGGVVVVVGDHHQHQTNKMDNIQVI